MLTDFCLNTAHLTLRPVSAADRADLIALEADAEVMRYLNGGLPVPDAGLSDADFLTPRGDEPEVLAVHHHAGGAFIGWFSLFDDGVVDGLRSAEIGYRLMRAAWGKGYATEGLRALIEAAFNTFGFDRVRAETMTVNQASRRVMEKAGLRHIKTVFPTRAPQIPGADQGEVIYEIRKAEMSRMSHGLLKSGPIRHCDCGAINRSSLNDYYLCSLKHIQDKH
ncbi:MAG: GNAT family N-acetyltransferase [Rhodoferax sp.]|uniref:GNAT family N-acetyltransferase n=1 Tax=Rhodoferax sp. TaxID=50421 RepID=UPI001B6C05A0|nr:GNAT family N-acetyltransferase [Rhodoferax sp.]MBP9906743.1 GNAT family N-acetyltransferase [Rhodoferax sp.]